MGAFYTDARVAEFLVRWALRSHADTVADPSFGGGVFLRAACQHVYALGGQPADRVYGVELDADAHQSTSRLLQREWGLPPANLVRNDFFRTRTLPCGQVTAVVGNPPFIRYQSFRGKQRERALARASEAGVSLSRLASSWAPFLVHAVQMLCPGGRLAMVVPAELGHAGYALPILGHIARQFSQATLLTFRRRLFPDLSEDTMLLLAEGKGNGCGSIELRDLANVEELEELSIQAAYQISDTVPMDTAEIARGHHRLTEYLLPRAARTLYRSLLGHSFTTHLGALADVGIGYVSGANSFFHLTEEQARFLGIPRDLLKKAVVRGRDLRGVCLTERDWLASGGQHLLHVTSDRPLEDALLAYLKTGEGSGIHMRYKCRTRAPWFSVPHVYRPDALLSYMGGSRQRLVLNEVGAVAANGLHVIRLRPNAGIPLHTMAATWLTSFTSLSCEIEGHALGGGMLKLEPSEAARVALAVPESVTEGDCARLVEEADCMVREGNETGAQHLADQVILRQGLGLTEAECRLLREAHEALRARRMSRGGDG